MGCPLFLGGGESSESLHRFSALASEDSNLAPGALLAGVTSLSGDFSKTPHDASAMKTLCNTSPDSRAFLKVASPLWGRKRREKKKHSFECERFFAFMIPPQHKVRAVNKVIDEMGLDPLLAKYKGGGAGSYHPKMMLKVLERP